MTLQCCVCRKVKRGQGWTIEARGGRADASHTYCPHCLEESLAAMGLVRAHADDGLSAGD